MKIFSSIKKPSFIISPNKSYMKIKLLSLNFRFKFLSENQFPCSTPFFNNKNKYHNNQISVNNNSQYNQLLDFELNLPFPHVQTKDFSLNLKNQFLQNKIHTQNRYNYTNKKNIQSKSYLMKNEYKFEYCPKKGFCDTISFSEDLDKLINRIERTDMDRIPQKNIRNFCIIAHIDHGKSTLSDRLLEKSGAINKLEKKNSQILDTLKVERERGITVKAQTATMIFRYIIENENKEKIEEEYILNLIDTPGHVDFSYEVARSLRPCQGAILLVDASKGVQAQTLSNFSQAKNLNLSIVPVINKIDLPTAHIDTTLVQMEKALGFSNEEVLLISAKSGINLEQVFGEIIRKIPPPCGNQNMPFRY